MIMDGIGKYYNGIGRWLKTGIGRYDVDDSGSMDTKELGRLLFTLIDNGIRVIDDFVIDSWLIDNKIK